MKQRVPGVRLEAKGLELGSQASMREPLVSRVRWVSGPAKLRLVTQAGVLLVGGAEGEIWTCSGRMPTVIFEPGLGGELEFTLALRAVSGPQAESRRTVEPWSDWMVAGKRLHTPRKEATNGERGEW